VYRFSTSQRAFAERSRKYFHRGPNPISTALHRYFVIKGSDAILGKQTE
jgi:hypothetical protein